MNRREFFRRSLHALGTAGFSQLITGCSIRPIPVTVMSVPDLDKDHHRDIAQVMSESLALRGKRVLLKPNFVEFHPGRPINTDIRLISQVAEACFVLGASEVSVGEAAGHRRDPWYSVYNPGLRENLNPRVRCVDMNHGDAIRLRNKGVYTGLPYFHVAAAVAAADVVISMPKLKTHHWVGVTLSMKNLFGTLPGIFYGWPKNLLHQYEIANSILDLALTVPSHYAIVDGVIGMEGDGPIMGSPRNVGTVVMGKDLLAVDATGARIMGFDPYKIPYLSAAGKHFRGLHESDVVYRGDHPRKFTTRFACLPHFAAAQRDSLFD